MQEGKETMERREISREELLENVRIHEEEAGKGRKLAEVCGRMYCIFVLLMFLYLRLYNTKFEFSEYNEKMLCIKYSTAWVVRFPAEYEGREVRKAFVTEWMDCRYPNILVVEVEKGISIISCKRVLLLRIPKCIISYDFFDHYKFVEIR